MFPETESMERVPVAPTDERPLEFVGKLWNLFVDPRRTFASVGTGHEWVILWLLASVISIAGYLPTKEIIQREQLTRMEEQWAKNPGISAEQRAEFRETAEKQFANPIYLLFVPLGHLIAMALVAGILLFVGNILLGGNTGYLRMLNAYAWTSMVLIPGTLVMVPLILARGSTDVSLGLGVLTSPDTGVFVKKLLSSFELFGLWQVWLCSVAVSVLAAVSTGRAFVSVFIIWLVWVVIQGGLAAAGLQFGM